MALKKMRRAAPQSKAAPPAAKTAEKPVVKSTRATPVRIKHTTLDDIIPVLLQRLGSKPVGPECRVIDDNDNIGLRRTLRAEYKFWSLPRDVIDKAMSDLLVVKPLTSVPREWRVSFTHEGVWQAPPSAGIAFSIRIRRYRNREVLVFITCL